MSWEKRDSGLQYYYEVKKAKGRLTKTYWGRGDVAHKAVELQVRQRLCREARRAERVLLGHVDLLVRESREDVRSVYRASLLAGGYRQRYRGPWRLHEEK
jgi:hypothetical protein